MKARYKSAPNEIRHIGTFNTNSLTEIFTGDDSAFPSDMEIEMPDGTWLCLSEAFNTKVVIPDNYHNHFRFSKSDEERTRGYY